MSAPQRFLILADGDFSPMTSKTANSVIRYQPERVVGVVDQVTAGRSVEEVLGFGDAIPVVATMEAGLALRPDAVLIGIAPMGGRLPEAWRAGLLQALEAGCDIWSGLHTFLTDDPALARRAKELGREIRDVRRPPPNLPVASGLARLVEPLVVLSVGTDCNVGKMTAQLQLTRGLNARGVRTRFVATGQTGIFIEGWGIAVDAVVADFIAGASEQLVLEGAKNADVVLVEGQGSINHPGYSGVTLGLLHGACPNGLILCHQASRTYISEYRPGAAEWLPVPPLSEYVRLYEDAGSAVYPTKVVAVCLNTYDMTDEDARAACAAATRDTGLPASDPVRFPEDASLLNAVLAARERYLATGRC
ncbi:MAG TPA: DUF1611 domain-containing protein [Gemmatimonadales bacterium]